MYLEDLRNYALSLADVEECFPFGEETFVYKTNGKMFLLIAFKKWTTQGAVDSDPEQLRVTVKSDPAEAIELREKYAAIVPGYHNNKKYWNTIYIDGTVPAKTVLDCIKESYRLVAKKVGKA